MRVTMLALLGSLVCATETLAQSTQEHRALWGGFGIGTGLNGSEGNNWGVSGYGRIGGTVNQKVLLGAETFGWYGTRDAIDLYRNNLSGILLFYPSERGGFYFKAGAGLTFITTSANDFFTVGGVTYYSGVSQSQTGFGSTAGVGFDVRLGRNIYLVPELAWYLEVVGDDGATFSVPSSINIFALTIGLVWH